MTIHTCSFTEKCMEDGGFHGCCPAHRAELRGEMWPANDPAALVDDVSPVDPERTL